MSKPYRFAAALSVVALADQREHRIRRSPAMAAITTATNTAITGDKALRSKLFGSTPRPAGPVLFGVNPGGAPWVIDRSKVEVRRDGRVKARIEGLVIPPQNNTNPLSNLAATVYCGGSAVGTTTRSRSPVTAMPDRREARHRAAEAVPRAGRPPQPGAERVVSAAAYIASTGKWKANIRSGSIRA